jgi:hypothetical protein
VRAISEKGGEAAVISLASCGQTSATQHVDLHVVAIVGLVLLQILDRGGHAERPVVDAAPGALAVDLEGQRRALAAVQYFCVLGPHG